MKNSDVQFITRMENFAFKEVVEEESVYLKPTERNLAILASLIACQGIDVFKMMLEKALDEGLDPVMVKELVYQSVDYVGMGKMWDFLKVVNEVLETKNLSLDAGEETTTMENRLEKGVEAQMIIFGDTMKEVWKNSTVNRWLAQNCFGDYYTRTGLSLAQREMITFCFLMALGGCEPQLDAHIQGNINLGNDPDFLVRVVHQCLPYIGYPRSLNALNAIKKIQ